MWLPLLFCIVLFGCSGASTGRKETATRVSSPPAQSRDREAAAGTASGETVPPAIVGTRIRLTFAGGTAEAVLEENAATQSLLTQLPAEVAIEDFAGAEKIAYLPQDLAGRGEAGYDPTVGDVACYGPWGNLVFFYGDQPYAQGLYYMGRVESGLQQLAALPEGSTAVIERV